MSTIWTERIFYFIPIGQRVAMNSRMSDVHTHDTGDPTAWDRAVPCRPSSPGTGPATALAINSAVVGTEKALWEADAIPGGQQYFQTEGWEWDTALADAGLEVVPTEPLP